jgi:hypothetical protein
MQGAKPISVRRLEVGSGALERTEEFWWCAVDDGEAQREHVSVAASVHVGAKRDKPLYISTSESETSL